MVLITPLIIYVIYKWKWTQFVILPALLAIVQHYSYTKAIEIGDDIFKLAM
jgi:hypothetical protein